MSTRLNDPRTAAKVVVMQRCHQLVDFLKEQGILQEARAIALKEAVAFQIQKAMEKEKISKVEMARRMKTSRAALDRFLAPGNASVTLQTLTRAARAVGRELHIGLV
ncbi:MAG TPA: hypothetical protein VG297_10795 [Bryobacteraceae bacterium]|jgi:hypothetical protein|nr:hypothetical protein [Bryobacteraceae bacterium]